jgi:dTDP-glucose 4,6-dehydratase
MDISRIRSTLGWTPTRDLSAGLAATVEWYLSHRTWWERVLSEAYRAAAAMYLV